MRIPMAVLLVVAVMLSLFWILRPPNQAALTQTRTDLPWQIQIYPDGTSKVFDLHLGLATLADAVEKFGPYENLAVFASEDGNQVLEAYFGIVRFGPLQARVITALAATAEELTALIQTSRGREGSPTGDWKFPLEQTVSMKQHGRQVQAISYIPTYGGLEQDYFRARFGEPSAWKTLERHLVQWYYPALGLSLLLNSKGKEVLEFVPPRAMRLPQDLEYATSPGTR